MRCVVPGAPSSRINPDSDEPACQMADLLGDLSAERFGTLVLPMGRKGKGQSRTPDRALRGAGAPPGMARDRQLVGSEQMTGGLNAGDVHAFGGSVTAKDSALRRRPKPAADCIHWVGTIGS